MFFTHCENGLWAPLPPLPLPQCVRKKHVFWYTKATLGIVDKKGFFVHNIEIFRVINQTYIFEENEEKNFLAARLFVCIHLQWKGVWRTNKAQYGG